MAEGIVDTILGRGADETGDGLDAASLDPSAAAAGMALANSDATLAGKIGQYFDEQRRLVEEQRARLRLRRTSDRLRIGMQVFVILLATALGAAAVAAIYDAARSQSVVVDPFYVSPPLEAKGPTGRLVAQYLLDQLTFVQTATRTPVAGRSLATAWDEEIKIEVPDTGLSFGQIASLLKARFGHDLHVGGDLIETSSGDLVLTVRGGGIPARSFSGSASELKSIASEAAEYIYGLSQPSRYETFLIDMKRYEDAVRFAKAAYAGTPDADRPYLLERWADATHYSGLGSLDQSLDMFRAALRLKPDLWRAWGNLIYYMVHQGYEERALQTGRDMIKRSGRPPALPSTYAWFKLTWDLSSLRDTYLRDLARTGGIGIIVPSERLYLLEILLLQHDVAGAELELQATQPNPQDILITSQFHFARGRLAMEKGDIAVAREEMQAFVHDYADHVVADDFGEQICLAALALDSAGDAAQADAILKSARPYVDCRRFQGDILDRRGDWPGAQRAYESAVTLAPDLAPGYYSWGAALARHGDDAGALEKFKAANQRAPRWADPLKGWGDILLKQGKRSEAVAKYDAALKYAPAWPELRAARDGR